jgi:formylglycine-generating enzyme required for sulfatase activity
MLIFRQSPLTIPHLLISSVLCTTLLFPGWASAEEVTVVTPSGGRHVMVLIPAGSFTMGNIEAIGKSPTPPHEVTLSSAYYIDKYEVSNSLYASFMTATGRRQGSLADDPQRNAPDQPVDGLTWYDATDYCTWAGLRLPTEAEWEKAARGTDARTYPWGNERPSRATAGLWNGGREVCSSLPDQTMPTCWIEGDSSDGYLYTAPVNSFPLGASPYGLLHMIDNAKEWVSDWYGSPSLSPQVDPQGPASGTIKVGKGGGTRDEAPWPVYGRLSLAPASEGLGFRCAQSVSAMPTTAIDVTGWGLVKKKGSARR